MYLIIVDGNVDTAEFCEQRPPDEVIRRVLTDSIEAGMVETDLKDHPEVIVYKMDRRFEVYQTINLEDTTDGS